jgi:hypothetical protein
MNSIAPAFARWPVLNECLRVAVAAMTDEQLALQPTPERWPLWATIGHLCCQRVSWLCGFAGEPGAGETPFPNALYRCPGDEYLEPAMSRDELLEAIDSTFRVVQSCLDRWSLDDAAFEIRRNYGDEDVIHSRGWILSGSLAHDAYHCAELNETLSARGLPMIELW